ncbi:MAG: hypothetical protein ACP5JG_07000, partial [Anaerolineae bacterium]
KRPRDGGYEHPYPNAIALQAMACRIESCGRVGLGDPAFASAMDHGRPSHFVTLKGEALHFARRGSPYTI